MAAAEDMTSNNRQQPAADRIGHYVRASIRPAANPSVKRAGAAKRESVMVAMLGWAPRRASYGRTRRERRTQKCAAETGAPQPQSSVAWENRTPNIKWTVSAI